MGPGADPWALARLAEEKPFEPSAARLARARREGDFPSSQAVGAIASFGCAVVLLAALLTPLAAAARSAVAQAAAARALSWGPYLALAAAALGVPCGAIAGALCATLLQGGRITVRAPAPKFDKINPAVGLRRMLSRDAAIGGVKALVVAFAVASAVIPALASAFAATRGAGSASALASLVLQGAAAMLAASLGVAGAFAIADVALERAKWKRRLRMSFAELRREYRQDEGDPLQRGRRRRAHLALVRGSIGRLREAAFVVCNPSHVAIALAYEPPQIPVPRVLVRAVGEGARAVKRRARALGVPIVENVQLARGLLEMCEVGDYIPASVYAAVAAIVAGLIRERSGT